MPEPSPRGAPSRQELADNLGDGPCENCGVPTFSWYVASDSWRIANGWPDHYEDCVLCPTCFVTRWEKATGLTATWLLTPDLATMRDRGHDEWMARHASPCGSADAGGPVRPGEGDEQ